MVDFDIKLEESAQLAKQIDGIGDIKTLAKSVKENAILDGQVQAYAIIPGSQWILGYYNDDEIKQHTLGASNFSHMNVFVNRPRESESFLVVVSFRQEVSPLNCSESSLCSGHGDCYTYPFSTHIGCKCEMGYSGDQCESSERNIQLQSVINSLLENTLKLPTFTSVQHGLEDAHMSLTASSNNIPESISNLETTIYTKFRSMGEFISRKFDLMNIYIKYQNAIENVQYFSSITNTEGFMLENKTDINYNNRSAYSFANKFSLISQRVITKFLLNPTGIKKWLYQINHLIVGRKHSEFTSHKPLIFLIMDKLKERLCFQDYKDEVTRKYRQLMLLQYQGFMLWGKAYSSAYEDSNVIASRYAKVLQDQTKYLDSATCSVNIPNSRSLQDCHGGYFIYKSMDVNVSCNDGYYVQGM